MVDYRFTLELTDYTVQKRVTVTQGEVAARRFIVNFSENGKPYALNPFSLVAFRMKTPLGKDIFDYCTVKGNSVEFIPTSVSVADNGLCDARIEIYGNETGSVLYSPKFEMYITEDKFRNSSVEASDEFTALQKIATDYVSAMEELNGPQGVITTAKEQVELAKAEAIKAEKQAEIAGVHAYEALLKSGEASKSVAEADRLAGEAATYANSAREFAEITEIAKNEAVESVTAAANSEAGAKKAKGDAEIAASAAGSFAHDAKNSADRAEAAILQMPTKTSQLENDSGFITEDEVYTKDETAEILQTGKLTKINGTVALQTANFYDPMRPAPEAYMYFECNEKLEAGCRYSLAITGGSSGYAISEIFIASAPPQDLDSNQISGCSFKEIESDMPGDDMVHTCTFTLPEDYPQPTPVYFVLCVEDDYIASLTEVPVVLEQLFEMGSSGELGDIEAALDGIIAIQNALIGGEG